MTGRLTTRHVSELWKRKGAKAHYAVQMAIRHGILQRPSQCEVCGQTPRRIHAAHQEYSEPLRVRWLCPKCHSRWDHGTLVEAEEEAMAEPTVFGKRLRQRLDEMDRGPMWLSRRLDCHVTTVAAWLSGRSHPNVARLNRIALTLQCTPGWLLGEPDTSQVEDLVTL